MTNRAELENECLVVSENIKRYNKALLEYTLMDSKLKENALLDGPLGDAARALVAAKQAYIEVFRIERQTSREAYSKISSEFLTKLIGAAIPGSVTLPVLGEPGKYDTHTVDSIVHVSINFDDNDNPSYGLIVNTTSPSNTTWCLSIRDGKAYFLPDDIY